MGKNKIISVIMTADSDTCQRMRTQKMKKSQSKPHGSFSKIVSISLGVTI